MHPQTRIALLSVALALGACNVYSPETRQGNFIDQTKFEQVKPGMTREQVRFLIGPPMVDDPFHRSQWDYYFRVEQGTGFITRHWIVKFDGDVVASIAELD